MLDVSPVLPSLRFMQIKLSKSAAGIFAGITSTAVAFAHPGHAPTETVAQLAHPFAGADHFAAFLTLTTLLLLALRMVVKYRGTKKETARK